MKYGDPRLPRSFWKRVAPAFDWMCWQWTGTQNSYGYLILGGRAIRAHRLAYEVLVGPIASGMIIDHLCLNKLCVNPAHLEQVTDQENSKRWAHSHPQKHCPRGRHRGCSFCHEAKTVTLTISVKEAA